MTTLPSDHRARQQALDIRRSYCVQAPAGSGKTELLTQRLLNLLAHCERPEDILAFTFTRKAATEMRQRLLQSLQQATASTGEGLEGHKRLTHELATAALARDRAQGWELLSNSRRLRINTIDSFTHYLSAQLPLSANLGARANIGTDMDRIFAAAVHATLALLDGTSPAAAAVKSLLRHLHNNLQTTEQLFMTLLGKRDQWLPLVASLRQQPAQARMLLEASLQVMIAEQLQQAATLLAPHRGNLQELLAYAIGNLQDEPDHPLHILASFNLADHAAADVRRWRALARFLLLSTLKDFRKGSGLKVKDGFPGKSSTKDKALQAEYEGRKEQFTGLVAGLQDAGLLPLVQLLGHLPDPHHTDAHWEVLDALAILLPLLAAQLDLAMQQAGQVDHTQTSLAALRALGSDEEPTDLALRLDYSIRHILVDEFQDTSSLQFHLLEKLSAGWQPDDGRTLFIVGDGMQSCYAFRNAKVGLFLRARDQGIGNVRLVPLFLTVNFRSDNSVVEWVNEIFGPSFPAVDDLARGGVSYSPSEARDPLSRTAGVQCRFWFDGDDAKSAAGSRRAAEAAAVAELVGQLQQEDPAQSIAILVRTRRHLDAIVPALRERGLRWNANEIDPLPGYGAIDDLCTLLRALLNIADQPAWFALLRTPFIGLALEDIQLLAAEAQAGQCSLWTALQRFATLPALGTDARQRLQRCVPPLQEARALRRQLPLRMLLEHLWLQLGGPACIDDPALLPNVESFLALVEAHEEHGDIADIHSFLDKLAKAHGSAVDPGVNLHLMTIHKAKGLEFDCVLLPGLDRTPRQGSVELLLWHEYIDAQGQSYPLLGLQPAKGADADPLYRFMNFEAARRTDLESTRLLYIGVTRAAKCAWLFGQVQHKDGVYTAQCRSLLATILPQLLARREQAAITLTPLPAAAPAFAPAATRIARQPLRRLPADWQSPLTESLLPLPPRLSPEESLHEQLLSRTIGELVHRGLQQLVLHGNNWPGARTALPHWSATLRPLCRDARELQDTVATVLRHLQNCLQAPQSAWLFTTPQQDDHCELALLDLRGGRPRELVIDRTFIDQSGTRWIIDYKSAAPTAGQSRTEFVAQQVERYRQQLHEYATLFREQPEPVRLALFFTALPLLHVLD